MKEFQEDVFGQLLKKQYYQESNLEFLKQQLVINNPDLNPLQVYKLFDPPKERTAGIGAQNILAAFSSLGIPVDANNINILIKRYDCNRDGLLNYTEVCEFFKPKDVSLSNQFISRAKNNMSLAVSDQAKQSLREIFLQILRVELDNEMTKSEMHSRPNFSLATAFELMNRVNDIQNDKITVTQLKNILSTHNVYTLDRDVQILFDRYDKNKDGIVSFQDFAGEILTHAQSVVLQE